MLSQLVYQCAPFLKGLKVSCILNIKPEECMVLQNIIQDTDILVERLNAGSGKCLVLLYRKSTFHAYLKESHIRAFINDYGYHGDTLHEIFMKLKERIYHFKKNNSGFPHEIGIFLGYPIEDVKGYINHKGKKSLLSGYWQVYHDYDKAKHTFLLYDDARVLALSEYRAGKGLKEIAVANYS